MTVFDLKYIEQGLLQEFGEKSALGAHLGGKLRSSRDENFRYCFMRVV